MKKLYPKLIIVVCASLLINGCVRRHSTYENSPPSYVRQETCDAKCKEAEAIKNEVEVLASKINLKTRAPLVTSDTGCTNRVGVAVNCSSEAAYNKKTWVTEQVVFLTIINGNSFPINCSGKIHLWQQKPFKAKISSGEKRELEEHEVGVTTFAGADSTDAKVYCSFDHKGKEAEVKLEFSRLVVGNIYRDITYNGKSWTVN